MAGKPKHSHPVKTKIAVLDPNILPIPKSEALRMEKVFNFHSTDVDLKAPMPLSMSFPFSPFTSA
jgi:hypothetical protein